MSESLPKRVFIYARVSTKEQLDGGGFDRQVTTCKQFCESKQWMPLRIEREQESGSVETVERPKLAQLMELCGPPETSALGVDTIIIERADRMARDLIVGELFYAECRAKGIKIYAADSGEELVNATGDPTRNLIRQVLGAVAEWVKAADVRKLQAGRRRKKELTGKPCGGPQPFGNTPRERSVCRLIVALRYRRGLTFVQIARKLNRGHRRINRARPGVSLWTPSTVHFVYQRHAGVFERPWWVEKIHKRKPRRSLSQRLAEPT